MKKILKKACVSFIALTLVLSMFSGLTASALPKGNTITAFGQEWEILEDEVYGCFEALQECVEDLEPEDYEEIDMDDSVWYHQMQVDDWWMATTYYYTADGPVKNNYACISQFCLENYKKPGEEGYEQVVYDRICNYASSAALDVEKERIAVTLRGPWTANNGDCNFVFVAPKTGKVVLYNEGLIQAASPNSNFASFSDPKGSGTVDLCIKKNDVIISDIITISVSNPTAEFPKAGVTGCFKVNEGDEIVIYLKSYDHTWENNTVFIDPVVAYTEIIEDEPVKKEETTENEETTIDETDNNENGLGMYLYIIIGAGILLVVAAVVVIILISKKKKATTSNDENHLEESPSNE